MMARAVKPCAWTMRRTVHGWSLYHQGQLVGSADDPTGLVRLVVNLTTDGEN